MRLLDRYLLRELLVPLGYCLSGFLIFWISFDLFTDLALFQRAHLKGREVLEYYVVKTPELLVVVLPIGLLLALLYTLTQHARFHELTAMRAAGVSLWRIAAPHLLVGLLLSLILFALNEFWVPRSLEVAEEILARHLPDQPTEGTRQWIKNFGFTNLRENRTWLIGAFNKVTGEMVQPDVEWKLPDGTRRKIRADRAAWVGDSWFFTNLLIIVYPPEKGKDTVQTHYPVQSIADFNESLDQVRSEIKVARMTNLRRIGTTQLSIREILDYQKLHPGDDSKAALLNTKLHGRWAAPWTCVVVVLIALPFGAASGRRNVFAGVASSISVCFVYYLLHQLSLALGTGGYLPPWLAAWAPNLVFGGIGAYLTGLVR